MDLSIKWLKEFVDIDYKPREFAEALTMSGSKVEGWRKEGEDISGVVIGRINSIVKHPNAEKLVICQVDIGGKVLQIVTGAHNLKVGDIVPVATDGSNLPGGVKIKKGKLRGEESNGMLCSIAELNLTLGDFPYAIEDGIFVIEEPCELGQDAKQALGIDDDVVEFEITSNRPDCLSVRGLARETAATYNVPFKDHTPVVTEAGGDIKDYLKSVKIDADDLCRRYMARVVKNINVAPSPRWMRERLRASGVRPINNIVDITNYVMLEYGQPMHAFDLNHVDGGEICVLRAKAGEKIVTLDGNEHELTTDNLCIADKNKPIAVAGVMGGEYSGIFDDTTAVVFESACFNGASVRNTAKSLGMRTDASSRYEKGLPPQLCEAALDRACELITLLGAGEVVSGCADIRCFDSTPKTVNLDSDWINKFLGTDIAHDEMVEILRRLDFKVDGDVITAPYYRTDIEHRADIAEEIARIWGYNRIPDTAIRGKAIGKVTPEQKFSRSIENAMLAAGYSQIITYSFISPKEYDLICAPKDSAIRDSVTILNPLGEDTSVMRTTALPSILETLATNYNRRIPYVKMFEVATEYINHGKNELPTERKKLMLGAYGNSIDFFKMKGAVETLFDVLNIKDVEFAAKTDAFAYHPGRTASITADGKEIGIIGEIHPSVAENYGINEKVYAADIDIAAMYSCVGEEKTYHPLPKFPSVTRDLSMICDEALPVADIRRAIVNGVGDILEHIELFDVYRGKQIPEGKKSVAYTFTLRSESGTLSEKQCTKAVSKAIDELKKLGAEIRS